jgi:AbrB family looped-hinge helix DNA binding protein
MHCAPLHSELSSRYKFVIIDLIMTSPARSESVRARLNENGRIVIPSSIREAVGLQRGDEVIVWAENGEVRIATAIQRARRAQQLVRKYVGEGVRLSDELIADRRREAGRE